MAKECIVCGKGRASGNNVSHSNRKTRRTFSANVHKVSVEVNGVNQRRNVCTRCMRTSKKSV